jgi:hypothetical protein
MSVNRGLLDRAFPANPRLRAELEAVLDLVDSIGSEATALKASLDAISAELDDGSFQPLSAILSAIAELTSQSGAVVLDNNGTAAVRPVDGSDPSSIMSRGVGYATFLTLGGRGPTGSRPTPSTGTALIYFDTTLGGKPIFNYANTGWVDSTGASV